MAKSIQFDERVVIRKVTCIDDMSEDQIRSTWFSEDEINHHRKRDRRLIHDISQREMTRAESEHIFVTSGLETEQARKQRKRRTRNARLCVLVAQESLWEMNQDEHPDEEEISEVYAPFARESALIARNRALQQEQRRGRGGTFGNLSRFFSKRIKGRRLDRHRSDPGDMLQLTDNDNGTSPTASSDPGQKRAHRSPSSSLKGHPSRAESSSSLSSRQP